MKEIICLGMAAYGGMLVRLPRDDTWRDHRDAYKDREYRQPRQNSKTKRSRVKRRRK